MERYRRTVLRAGRGTNVDDYLSLFTPVSLAVADTCCPVPQGCKLLQTLQIDKCYSVSNSAVVALLKRLPSASKARYWTGFAPQSAMIIAYHRRKAAQIAGAKAIQKQVRRFHVAWRRDTVGSLLTSGCLSFVQYRLYVMKKRSWEERLAEAKRMTKLREDGAVEIQRIARGMLARIHVNKIKYDARTRPDNVSGGTHCCPCCFVRVHATAWKQGRLGEAEGAT